MAEILASEEGRFSMDLVSRYHCKRSGAEQYAGHFGTAGLGVAKGKF